MGFFKNRIVAIIIAALIIAGSTGAAAISGITRLYEKKVEVVFENEIEGKMSNCADAANGVALTLISYTEYQEQMTQLRSARNGYLDSSSVDEKIYYYASIRSSMDSVRNLVAAGTFSEADKTKLNAYFSSYDTAVIEIARNSGKYNNSVTGFEKTIAGFPANFFAGFTEIRIPDTL